MRISVYVEYKEKRGRNILYDREQKYTIQWFVHVCLCAAEDTRARSTGGFGGVVRWHQPAEEMVLGGHTQTKGRRGRGAAVCGMANQSVEGSGQYSPRADGLQDVSVSRRGGKREKFDVTYAASSGHCAPFIPLCLQRLALATKNILTCRVFPRFTSCTVTDTFIRAFRSTRILATTNKRIARLPWIVSRTPARCRVLLAAAACRRCCTPRTTKDCQEEPRKKKKDGPRVSLSHMYYTRSSFFLDGQKLDQRKVRKRKKRKTEKGRTEKCKRRDFEGETDREARRNSSLSQVSRGATHQTRDPARRTKIHAQPPESFPPLIRSTRKRVPSNPADTLVKISDTL